MTMRRRAGIGIDRLASRMAAAPTSRAQPALRRHRARIAWTRLDRIRRIASAGVDTVARGTTDRVGGGARWVQPWFGAASRVRQRVEFDSGRLRPDLQEPRSARRKATRAARIVRVQTDVAAIAAFGFSGGVEWLG